MAPNLFHAKQYDVLLDNETEKRSNKTTTSILRKSSSFSEQKSLGIQLSPHVQVSNGMQTRFEKMKVPPKPRLNMSDLDMFKSLKGDLRSSDLPPRPRVTKCKSVSNVPSSRHSVSEIRPISEQPAPSTPKSPKRHSFSEGDGASKRKGSRRFKNAPSIAALFEDAPESIATPPVPKSPEPPAEEEEDDRRRSKQRSSSRGRSSSKSRSSRGRSSSKGRSRRERSSSRGRGSAKVRDEEKRENKRREEKESEKEADPYSLGDFLNHMHGSASSTKQPQEKQPVEDDDMFSVFNWSVSGSVNESVVSEPPASLMSHMGSSVSALSIPSRASSWSADLHSSVPSLLDSVASSSSAPEPERKEKSSRSRSRSKSRSRSSRNKSSSRSVKVKSDVKEASWANRERTENKEKRDRKEKREKKESTRGRDDEKDDRRRRSSSQRNRRKARAE